VALYELRGAQLADLPSTTYLGERVLEGRLQAALREHLDVLFPGVTPSEAPLVVAEEYADFAGSRRRIDLLAVDRSGQLVVVELKRTEDGGHMELQALRYAAMVSTMTFDQLVKTYADHAGLDEDTARERLGAHLDDAGDTPELATRVKVVLVSSDFSREITSTALWLRENYNVDITCVRLVPYRHQESLVLDVQQIIPLPEAAAYRIEQERKQREAAISRASDQRDLTKYVLTFDDTPTSVLNKRQAVRTAVEVLLASGIPFDEVRDAVGPGRWRPVHHAEGVDLREAFAEQHPDLQRPGRWWLDKPFKDDGVTWVMLKVGGTDTEGLLEVLANLARLKLGRTMLRWEALPDQAAPAGNDDKDG
jgi:hypothetical protein